MTKKHFIALADFIKESERNGIKFPPECIVALAEFCSQQNPHFDASRWLGYVTGVCGSSGGQSTDQGRKGGAA